MQQEHIFSNKNTGQSDVKKSRCGAVFVFSQKKRAVAQLFSFATAER